MTPDYRRVSRTGLFTLLLICGSPMTGQGEEPTTGGTVDSILAPSPVEPALKPTAGTTEEPILPPAIDPPEPPASAEQRTAPGLTEPSDIATPDAHPPSTADEPSSAATQAPSSQPSILINGFSFTGNTVVTNERLQAVTQPFIGEPLDLVILEKAAQAITDYYRKQGYTLALAYVPQQDIKFGVVELAVLEGTIGDVTVSGNRYYSSSFITRHFSHALKEKVARNESLERGLLLLNEYPGLKTSATLEAGKSVGTTDVHVTVEDKRPLHVLLDMNNYGFNTISRYRFGAGVEAGNVLVDGGTLNLNAIFGNQPNQLLFGMGSYSVPIRSQGTKVVLGGSHGKFDVGGQLSFLQIRGIITTGDIAITHPFIKSRFQNLLAEFGFSAKNNSLTLLDTTIGDDAVRLLKVGMNWDRLDLSGRWYASVYGFQGLGQFLGGMDNNSSQATRAGADNRFTKATVATGRIQSLGHDVLLVLKGSGQITTGPVVVIEQMLLGGPDSVRGYQLGERFVDQGFTLSAETRIPFFPSLMPAALKQTQGTIFVDYGAGSVRNPSPGEQRSSSMTGTGVGLQTLLPWYNANIRLDLGFPIGPKPIGGTLFGDRSPTLYFSIASRF
jgi:hemolysin activation/secretion protein